MKKKDGVELFCVRKFLRVRGLFVRDRRTPLHYLFRIHGLFRARVNRRGVLLRRRRGGMRSGVCGSLLLLSEAALVFSLDGFIAPVLGRRWVRYMVNMACTGDIRT